MKWAITLAAALCAGQASAQAQCANTIDVYDFLAEQHGESRQSRGFAESGAFVEMFANLETGSWTALVTLPDGQSCVVASGMYFETEAAPPAPQGSKA